VAGDSSVQAGAAFTTIIAAACATETYLSEVLAHLADKRFITSEEREEIRRKDGLWSKYNALAKKFGGGIDGLPVYRPYQALIHLRNCLVHRSAEYLEPGAWPREIAPFRTDIPHASSDGLDWTSEIRAIETAEWALRTAAELLARVDDHISDPGRLPFIDPGAGA
jgi:hypothetical protein